MPATPAPPAASASRARAPPKTAPLARATRSKATATPRDGAATPMPAAKSGGGGSGFLARGKEGLRKVSDKIKEGGREGGKGRVTSGVSSAGGHKEPLQAYLRIRPPPQEASSDSQTRPYLEVQNDKEVLMRAPADSSRSHIPKAPLIFSFDKVFPSSAQQSSVFTQTTLPLVEKLLQGENGLMFAYGVTNSGKSYTISGSGARAEEQGIVPRAIDVVFNSIEGLQSKSQIRCTGPCDIEIDGSMPAIQHRKQTSDTAFATEEAVKVDRNYSYALFVSYIEVHFDKIFDLLDPAATAPPTASSSQEQIARKRMMSTEGFGRASNFGLNSSVSLAATANGGAGVIRRKALQLKRDPDGNGKYVAGTNEIRVNSREEAMNIFQSGQSTRQVFSTLSNRESSRSHGIFTLKVVRIHNGAPDDLDSAQVSRLAIVDLAGSERNKHTGTTGERLKEAGKINESLMVLGQCLETLRSNQQKLAAAAAQQGGAKAKLDMVPFRHSKLTEIFQNFFVGDGRAVMIVNVNPYDTGFDENSHVMRFSAVAREVQTTANNKVSFSGFGLKRQISSIFKKQQPATPMKVKVVVPVYQQQQSQQQLQQLVQAHNGKLAQVRPLAGRETDDFVMVEEELEVVEEDEESGEEDEEDERDVLVESLFAQLGEMRSKLFEAETRNAELEADLRQEMAETLERTRAEMERVWSERLQQQREASEMKLDKKVDIMARMTPAASRFYRDSTREASGTPFSHADTSVSRVDESDISTADQTFASALDTSHISLTDSDGSTSIRQGRMSDPFIAKSPLPVFKITRSSEAGVAEEDVVVASTAGRSDGLKELAEADEVLDEDSLPATPPAVRSKREETAESEDVLAASFDSAHELNVVRPARDGAVDASDDEEDDDEEDDEDQDEEDDEDDDDDEEEEEEEEEESDSLTDLEEGFTADQIYDSSFVSSSSVIADDEEPSDSESSFEVTESDNGVSSEEEDVVRRASRARRTTGSPRKKSPVKRSAASTASGKRGPRKDSVPVQRGAKAKVPVVEIPVLGERKGQDAPSKRGSLAVAKDTPAKVPVTTDEEKDEDEDSPVVTKPKRKRTLGKKIVLEDDMEDAPPVGGAEVRRMIRTS